MIMYGDSHYNQKGDIIMICFVCGKEVNEFDDYELFGMDGDMIHKKCKPNVNNVIDSIVNMTDEQFERYMTDKN